MLKLIRKLFRMTLTLVVLAVAAVAAVVGVGMSLPQSHVETLSAAFGAPPETVWKTITDVGEYPSWRPDVKAVERLPDAPTGPKWVEIGTNDERLPLETVEVVAPKKFVARIGPGQPFGGTWTYELAPEGTGSRLTITERGEVYSPIYRFMARFVFGYTATMERYFAALDRKLAAKS